MRVEPLTVEHLLELEVQPHQRLWCEERAGLDLHILIGGGNQAWAGLVEGRPVVAMGVIDAGGGRAQAWGLLSEAAGPVFLPLHRACLRYLQHVCPYRRLEAVVSANFQPARRWAEMLGLSFEGTMRAYCHDGSDAELWAKVS